MKQIGVVVQHVEVTGVHRDLFGLTEITQNKAGAVTFGDGLPGEVALWCEALNPLVCVIGHVEDVVIV